MFSLLFAFGSMLGVVLIPLLVVLIRSRRWRKAVRPLQEYLRGSHFVYNTLQFDILGRSLKLFMVGSGGNSRGSPLTSYPVVFSYVDAPARLVFGNAGLTKYVFDLEMGSERKTVALGDMSLIISSDSKDLLARVERALGESAQSAQVKSLFEREFMYLKINKETVVGGPTLLQRRYILRYFGLPTNELANDPVSFQTRMETLVGFLRKCAIS